MDRSEALKVHVDAVAGQPSSELLLDTVDLGSGIYAPVELIGEYPGYDSDQELLEREN